MRLESRNGLDAKFGVEPIFRNDGFGYGILDWVEEDGRKAHATVLFFVLDSVLSAGFLHYNNSSKGKDSPVHHPCRPFPNLRRASTDGPPDWRGSTTTPRGSGSLGPIQRDCSPCCQLGR